MTRGLGSLVSKYLAFLLVPQCSPVTAERARAEQATAAKVAAAKAKNRNPRDDSAPTTAPSNPPSSSLHLCRPAYASRIGVEVLTIFAGTGSWPHGSSSTLLFSVDYLDGRLANETARETHVRVDGTPQQALCNGALPLLCRVRLAHRMRGQLLYGGHNLTAKLCVLRRERVRVAACVSLFTPALMEDARRSELRLATWIPFMAKQVDRIHAHTLDAAPSVRNLTHRHPQLAVHTWAWLEQVGLSVVTCRDCYRLPHQLGSGQVNPYIMQRQVLTKCAYEADAQWIVNVDVDEFWKARPPAPALTIGEHLGGQPAHVMQLHFCAISEGCWFMPSKGKLSVRPKTALRTDGRCDWWVTAHMAERAPWAKRWHANCAAAQDVWTQYTHLGRCHHPLFYYFSHDDRKYGGNVEWDRNCDDALRAAAALSSR